jgi:hypothetical protein
MRFTGAVEEFLGDIGSVVGLAGGIHLNFIPRLRKEQRENWSKMCEAYAPLKLRASLAS